MKQRVKELLVWIYFAVAVMVIVYAFSDVVIKNPNWYHDLMSYCLIIMIMATLMLVFFYVRLSIARKRNKVYLSFNMLNENEAQRIIDLFPSDMQVYSTAYIFPGTNVNEIIPNYIASCSLCYILFGSKISQIQKFEIAEMNRQHKKVIPIILNVEDKIPQNLRNIMPITYTDFIEHPIIA